MLELEFRKEGILVRKYVDMPLGGRQEVVQKISYEEIRNAKFEMHVESIRKVDEDNCYKLVFEVRDFRLLSSPKHPKRIRIRLSESCFKYNLIYIRKYRDLFPRYKEPFILEIEGIGPIRTYVTSAPKGTKKGDPKAGNYIQKGLYKFFRKYKGILKPGDEIIIEILEPYRRYKLLVPKAKEP